MARGAEVSLDNLKRKRRELDRQIKAAEKSEAEAKKQKALSLYYVKVACARCSGRGEVAEQSGSDNMDFVEIDCQECGGRGYLYARAWEGPRGHDMEYNQVVSVA